MGISTFGGSVSNASTSASTLVTGQLLQVPTGFSNSNYVDSGAKFSASTYPALAAITPPTFMGDYWTKTSIPSALPKQATTNNMGSNPIGFSYGGEYFVIGLTGVVFRTTGGNLSSLAYLKTLTFPSGVTTINSINVANGNIYVAFLSSTTWYMYSDLNLSSATSITFPLSNFVGIVRYGNGVYLAQYTNGTNNVVYKSTDGVTFASVTVGTTSTYTPKGLDWNGSSWVYVTSGTSTNNTATSPDGTTWTVRSGPTVGFSSLRWNSVLSIFVGPSGTASTTINTSPDGVTWTARTGAISNTFANVEVMTNGAMIVTIVNATTTNTQYSTDGITWTSKASLYTSGGPFFTTAFGSPHVYGNQLVNVGYYASGAQIVVNWTNDMSTLGGIVPLTMTTALPVFYPMMSVGNTWITFENTQFNQISVSVPVAITTNGGASWTYSAITSQTVPIYWRQAFVTPTKFILWGTPVTGNGVFIASSSDGVNWTINSPTLTWVPSSVCNVGENIFIGGQIGANFVMTADYGVTTVAKTSMPWPNNNSVGSTTGITMFSLGNTLVDITVIGGGVSVSNDLGVTWISGSITSITSAIITGVAYGNGKALLTINSSGNSTYVYSSDGGNTWVQRTFPAPISTNAKGVAYINGYFVIYGGGGSYWYGNDGINWSQGVTGTTSDMIQSWTLMGNNGMLSIAGGNNNITNFLVPDTTSYRTPLIPSALPFTKFVIKAT
jgi:hypothetical protein